MSTSKTFLRSCKALIADLNEKHKSRVTDLAPSMIEELKNYHWPELFESCGIWWSAPSSWPAKALSCRSTCLSYLNSTDELLASWAGTSPAPDNTRANRELQNPASHDRLVQTNSEFQKRRLGLPHFPPYLTGP